MRIWQLRTATYPSLEAATKQRLVKTWQWALVCVRVCVYVYMYVFMWVWVFLMVNCKVYSSGGYTWESSKCSYHFKICLYSLATRDIDNLQAHIPHLRYVRTSNLGSSRRWDNSILDSQWNIKRELHFSSCNICSEFETSARGWGKGAEFRVEQTSRLQRGGGLYIWHYSG